MGVLYEWNMHPKVCYRPHHSLLPTVVFDYENPSRQTLIKNTYRAQHNAWQEANPQSLSTIVKLSSLLLLANSKYIQSTLVDGKEKRRLNDTMKKQPDTNQKWDILQDNRLETSKVNVMVQKGAVLDLETQQTL